MKSHTKTKFAAFYVVLIVSFCAIVTLFVSKPQDISSAPPPQITQVLGSETHIPNQPLPVRLSIPKLTLDASIEYVGITAQGEMAVPQDTNNVGWFALGKYPGEPGSAVIAGHLNGVNGSAGVFSRLNELQTGDKVYVKDSMGTSRTFLVRESRMYDPGLVPDVFSLDDGTHLNLITCDGEWNTIKKSYSKRLVVFTDLSTSVENLF